MADVLEVIISDEDVSQAAYLQSLMHDKMEGFESTRNLNDDRDIYGFLGQTAVVRTIEGWGFYVKASPYFNPSLKGDDGDFEWRYEKCDVKASPVSEDFPKVYPGSRFLVKDDSKKVNRYVFCKVNIPERRVYIAGCMDYNKFWRVSKPLESHVKHPGHYVQARELDSFKDFIYA